jgi:hypothetical protein
MLVLREQLHVGWATLRQQPQVVATWRQLATLTSRPTSKYRGLATGPLRAQSAESASLNAAGFVGSILIVATDERTGATRDMSDEEIRKGLAYLQRFQDVQHPGVACGFVSGAENVARVLAEKARRITSDWDSL